MIPIRERVWDQLRPIVRDGGEWRGPTLEEWRARFCGRSDAHAGALPVLVGRRAA